MSKLSVKSETKPFDVIVIGCSWGGMDALATIMTKLPESLPVSIVIVQHLHKSSDNYLAYYLNEISAIDVCEAKMGQPLQNATVYIAPADYHLLIEDEKTFSLSVDRLVHFSRPSIDVLFDSAADTYKHRLIGVILTGNNADGSTGLAHIKDKGGTTIVQTPATSKAPMMPEAALKTGKIDHVVDLEAIAPLLLSLITP